MASEMSEKRSRTQRELRFSKAKVESARKRRGIVRALLFAAPLAALVLLFARHGPAGGPVEISVSTNPVQALEPQPRFASANAAPAGDSSGEGASFVPTIFHREKPRTSQFDSPSYPYNQGDSQPSNAQPASSTPSYAEHPGSGASTTVPAVGANAVDAGGGESSPGNAGSGESSSTAMSMSIGGAHPGGGHMRFNHVSNPR